MGGCCCCSSNRVEWNNSPRLYHVSDQISSPFSSTFLPLFSISSFPFHSQYPVVPENGAASVVPTSLLVDTNLDTSIPDTYTHPPLPLPYEANVGDPVQTNSSDANEDIKTSENVTKETMESETDIKLEDDGEVKKSKAPFVPPEECPTCLEEYDEENPKIVTKCEHRFHLSCILEWMERSNTCPVCDQIMELNYPINE